MTIILRDERLGERCLLPTRQQGTVLTLGNHAQLGKGGTKQSTSGCNSTEKALSKQQRRGRRECRALHLSLPDFQTWHLCWKMGHVSFAPAFTYVYILVTPPSASPCWTAPALPASPQKRCSSPRQASQGALHGWRRAMYLAVVVWELL